RIRDHTSQARIVRYLSAENCRVDLSCMEHGFEALAGCTLDAGRVAVLGNMRVLERYPLHAFARDAIVIGEDTAQPGASCLRVGAHADAVAGKVGRADGTAC